MLPASVASVLHLVWPLPQSLSSMVKPTRSKTPAGLASGVFEAHKLIVNNGGQNPALIFRFFFCTDAVK